MYLKVTSWVAAAGMAAGMIGGAAYADTIDPTSFTANLAVGESVTIEKTVVVEAGGTSTGLLDVMFLIDTTGSMSGAIAGAKAAAADILSGLSGYGDLASGAGVFGGGVPSMASALPGRPINSALSTNTAATSAAIASTTLGNPDGGGDFPERGQDAVKIQADLTAWRPGSKRFIIALGDSSWNNDTVTDAEAIAALAAEDVELIGLRFSNYSGADSNSDDLNFTESVEDLGGTVFETGTDPDEIVAAILAAIEGSYASYSSVTVDDLGGGGGMIDVSAVCTGADIGSCNGAFAEGDYTREEDRTFTFDVTFTRTGAGDASFPTFAIVDKSIVAKEDDRFPGDGGPAVVPLPAAGWLLIAGLGGLVAAKRRKS